MVEHGAHLTLNISEKPSIFEVLAQESLAQGLRHSIRYLASFLADTYPNNCGILAKYIDEIILGSDFIVQYYHLKTYHGTFSEHFYGLKRVSYSGGILQRSHIVRSVLITVILPYIRNKLDNIYQELLRENIHQIQHANTESSTRDKMIKAYLLLYPYLHTTIEGSYFGFCLFYALGKSRIHTLSLALASVELATLTRSDLEVFRKERAKQRIKKSMWYLLPLMLARRGVQFCMDGLSSSLMTGAFFLQFLEWWYSQRRESPFSVSTLQIPRPPPKIELANQQDDGVCPVCLKPITNETVLAVSGFAFCYPCIHSVLMEKKCCPITGYPATFNDLIRIYRS